MKGGEERPQTERGIEERKKERKGRGHEERSDDGEMGRCIQVIGLGKS
jgi:hypothetical protein